MTGSTTSGDQPCSRIALPTRRTSDASASMPVLSAAGGRSSASAASCAATIASETVSTASHAAGVLRREGDDDRGAEDAELVEGLQVGLDAGAAAGVRAGDGERDLHRVSVSMTSPLRTMIRDLHRRRGRERRGLALAEGVRLVEEALDAGPAAARRRDLTGAGSYHARARRSRAHSSEAACGWRR